MYFRLCRPYGLHKQLLCLWSTKVSIDSKWMNRVCVPIKLYLCRLKTKLFVISNISQNIILDIFSKHLNTEIYSEKHLNLRLCEQQLPLKTLPQETGWPAFVWFATSVHLSSLNSWEGEESNHGRQREGGKEGSGCDRGRGGEKRNKIRYCMVRFWRREQETRPEGQQKEWKYATLGCPRVGMGVSLGDSEEERNGMRNCGRADWKEC